MMTDAQRWDARYRAANPPEKLSPPAVVTEAISHLSVANGRGGDIACGWGDAGLWLAQQGVSVTCFDVSAVALAAVTYRAETHGLEVATALHDTRVDGTPHGPWDLLCCTHYLDRDVLRSMSAELGVGGVTAIAIATHVNLERHPRPSARFLLEPGELHALTTADTAHLEILRSDEAWRDNGVHEAWMIAKRVG